MKLRLPLVVVLGCITLTAAIADTSKNDIKKLASSIKRSKHGKMVTSVKLGAQDDAFAVVRVNSRWQKLSAANRKSIAKSWWRQWATLRTRSEEWVAVTVETSKGKQLLNCQGDSRKSCQCD